MHSLKIFNNFLITNTKIIKNIRCLSIFSADNLLTHSNLTRCVSNLQKVPTVSMFSKKSGKYASVLIPICTDLNGNLSLLYTKRSPKLRTHVRQYSFPGGMRDDSDSSYIECALRETEEEIGLFRTRVKVWGTGTLIRPPHTPAIMPVVGTIDNLSLNELKLNEDEVEEVITVTIADLCLARKHTQFKSGYSAPVFIVNNGHTKIWGITGLITNMFLSCFLPNNIFTTRIEYIKPIRVS